MGQCNFKLSHPAVAYPPIRSFTLCLPILFAWSGVTNAQTHWDPSLDRKSVDIQISYNEESETVNEPGSR